MGTPYYLSPELCQNKPYNERVRQQQPLSHTAQRHRATHPSPLRLTLLPLTSPPITNTHNNPRHDDTTNFLLQSDVWSLGVLLYQCCTLRLPFEANNPYLLMTKIIKVLYSTYPPRAFPLLDNTAHHTPPLPIAPA